MGGNTGATKPGGPSNFGAWGQVDPLGSGDARKFEYLGGNQQQFESLTPEQQNDFRTLNVVSDPTINQKNRAWMTAHGFGTGGGAGGPAGAAGDAYEQAATPNINNAWGSQQWVKDPITGQMTEQNNLNGSLTGSNSSLEAQYADMLRQPFDDGTSAREQATDAAYKQATSRLDPQWAKREEAQRTQLLNQGLDPSTEAGKNAMAEMGLQRNDAYSSAMNNAIGQGREAGESVFRQNQAARMAPLQQMQMLKMLSQQGATPQLLNAVNASRSDARGYANQQSQNTTDLYSGAMQLAGRIPYMF